MIARFQQIHGRRVCGGDLYYKQTISHNNFTKLPYSINRS